MSWDQIPGWFDFDDIYDQAVEEASATKPSFFVEIGVAFGRSTAYMARKILDSKKPITLFAIDPWVDDWDPDWASAETKRPTWGGEHADWARAQGGPFNAFIEQMRLRAREELEIVRVIRARSGTASCMFSEGGLDFVFIDGSHRYPDVLTDIRLYKPLIRQGGVIAGHDYTHEFPGVVQAVHESFGALPARRSSFWKRLE